MTRSLPTPKARVSSAGSSWRSKPKDWLLYLILFLAPTQLGVHFWPDSSLVYGIRIDYLSPTLYALDVLILIYLFIHSLKNSFNIQYSLFLFLPILLTNLLFSQNPLATLSWSLHFLLYSLFILTLSPRMILDTCYKTLPLAILSQLILGATQVVLGHSLQGPLYWLGERMVAVGSPNVALATFMDQVVLRAYGTFGHPNVLAGWLVICLLIIIQISQTAIPIVSKQRAISRTLLRRKTWLQAKLGSPAGERSVLYGTLALAALGVALTQSRAAALALFGLVIPFYLIKTLRLRTIYFTILASLIIGYWSWIIPARSDLSSSERLSLQQISLSVIRTYPIFGTGANASISTYPSLPPTKPLGEVGRLLQPDHNSLTLFLSWFGLIGILGFFPILKSRILNLKSFLPLAPLLLLDHYLLTSPQGLFIFILFLRIFWLSDQPTL